MKYDSVAFYVFLATIVLSPLAFWSGLPLDLVKTLLITVGILASAILLGFAAIKEKRLALPPKSLVWLSLLVVSSLIISALTSVHVLKSLFGQGFEIGTVNFIALLFLSALTAFTIVLRRRFGAITLYLGVTVSFLILYIIHILRLLFGVKFLTFSVLNLQMSSLLGGWFNLGTYCLIGFLISLVALQVLPLAKKMKVAYWILLVLSAAGSVFVNDTRVWSSASLILLGLTVLLSAHAYRASAGQSLSVKKRLALVFKKLTWIPLIACLVAFFFANWGGVAVQKSLAKHDLAYTEVSLPWQMTLDVTASALKNYPILGVGPNLFGKAYIAYKPVIINTSDYWNVEFNSGFGMLPTFVATQGILGLIIWVLFLVFFGILVVRVLKNLPSDSEQRFVLLSSLAVSIFLWLMVIVSVPSHSILLLVFVFTGIFFGMAIKAGSLPANNWVPVSAGRSYRVFPSLMAILILIGLVWGLIEIKKTVAFAYFSAGVSELNQKGNALAADHDFSKALKFDSSDIYWQGRVESGLVEIRSLAGQITANSSASSSQEVLGKITAILNQSLSYAKSAIAYDPSNYYNYLSAARVSEAAADIRMPKAYETAVQAYVSAANTNPFNPSIYLSLGSFQARQSKLDDALQTVGAALQVKNNYLDAVFLLSQIYAAKGDLPNAITAANVATQLNPQNAVLLFQLGLLRYSNKDYAGAADALIKALKIQPDYANAKYFLGLSAARLNDMSTAIAQFSDLAGNNPDNQEVALILANLRAGRSIFSEAKPPVTTPPEKRSNLPLKEKKQ